MTSPPSFPNLIAGHKTARSHFWARSPFYPQYRFQVADASDLDVAAAIGAARRAERLTPPERAACLRKAADLFQVESTNIEHTVRMTGLPYQVVAGLLDEVPTWLREVVDTFEARFESIPDHPAAFVERVARAFLNIRTAVGGFCYAVTPANDPRAAALVTANLGYLGIPAILKATKGDAISPLIIQALITAGFDPGFFNLLYFDNRGPNATAKHVHLVDQANVIWTFGGHAEVDAALRYRVTGAHTILDLSGLEDSAAGELAGRLGALPDRALAARLQTQAERHDGFAGKTVLYHAHAACAAIISGPFDATCADFLYRSTAYASGCNATRAIACLAGPTWVADTADFFATLKIGDPLDPQTEVGYIPPTNLDYLESLLHKYRHSIRIHGGQRLSPCQAAPVLVESNAAFPELFGQEIPAYYLAIYPARDLTEAVMQLNRAAGETTRMAVALHGTDRASTRALAPRLNAQIILHDQPTTRVIPHCHEGNDYASLLTQLSLYSDG